MKYRLKFIGVALLIIGFMLTASAQQKSLPLTADSLSTGNYKDVFRSFFQLAFDGFTSKQKEVQFTSNPFAVMARADTALLLDYNYYRYRHLRALNFSFGAKLDTSYKFNGFSSGIKYALVNKRDETISREFVKNAYEANDENNRLNNAVTAFLSTLDATDPKRALYRTQANDLFSGRINFSQVDEDFQTILKSKAKELGLESFLRLLKTDAQLNLARVKKLTYDSLKKLFQNGLLITVGISDTTYKDQFAFSNLAFSSQLLKGITQPLKPVGLELDIRGAINLVDDSLSKGRDLRRSVLVFEPGLNVLFKVRRTQYPWAEFKLSGSYTHLLGGKYLNEERTNLTLNGTLRIRIINDIWIPLEIKYDPQSGNVFGLLNIRFNFTGTGRQTAPKS